MKIIFLLFLIVSCFYMLSFSKKRSKKHLKNISMQKIDKMTGIEFEEFLMKLLNENGWKVEMTKISGDFGADLIGKTPKGASCVIQAKRYSKHVSLKAVQEVIGAQGMYKAKKAFVITNNYLTKSAKILAQKTGVEIWERERLVFEMKKKE